MLFILYLNQYDIRKSYIDVLPILSIIYQQENIDHMADKIICTLHQNVFIEGNVNTYKLQVLVTRIK